MSDPRLLDDAEDQGDEVDDEAIEGRDEGALDAAGDHAVGYILPVALEEVGHLIGAQDGPEDAHHQGGDADFLDPGRGFPRGEEQGDEKEGNDDHPDGTSGNEDLEDFGC